MEGNEIGREKEKQKRKKMWPLMCYFTWCNKMEKKKKR